MFENEEVQGKLFFHCRAMELYAQPISRPPEEAIGDQDLGMTLGELAVSPEDLSSETP